MEPVERGHDLARIFHSVGAAVGVEGVGHLPLDGDLVEHLARNTDGQRTIRRKAIHRLAQQDGRTLGVVGFEQRACAGSVGFFVDRGGKAQSPQLAAQRWLLDQRFEGRQRTDQARLHIVRAKAVEFASLLHRIEGIRRPALGNVHRIQMPSQQQKAVRWTQIGRDIDVGAARRDLVPLRL